MMFNKVRAGNGVEQIHWGTGGIWNQALFLKVAHTRSTTLISSELHFFVHIRTDAGTV